MAELFPARTTANLADRHRRWEALLSSLAGALDAHAGRWVEVTDFEPTPRPVARHEGAGVAVAHAVAPPARRGGIMGGRRGRITTGAAPRPEPSQAGFRFSAELLPRLGSRCSS